MNTCNVVLTSPSVVFLGQYEDRRLWVEYFVGDIKSSLLMIDFDVEYIGFARARKNNKPAKWYDFNQFVRHIYGRKQTTTTETNPDPTEPGECSKQRLFNFDQGAKA